MVGKDREGEMGLHRAGLCHQPKEQRAPGSFRLWGRKEGKQGQPHGRDDVNEAKMKAFGMGDEEAIGNLQKGINGTQRCQQ